MTRKEAYQEFSEWYNLGFGHSTMPGSEVLTMAMKSLHPITREQVEKMRGEWVYMADDDGCEWPECSRCEHGLDSLEAPQNFCPECGAPMTDKAVDILWKRLEAMQDAAD